MVEVLYAYMNGRFVGELRRESDGELSFIKWRQSELIFRFQENRVILGVAIG